MRHVPALICKSEGGSLSAAARHEALTVTFDMCKLTLALFFTLIVAPGLAIAQIPVAPPTPGVSPKTIDEVRKDYRIHGGPFYVNPAILLKELGVDTNVYNQAGDQQSDFTFTVTPEADVAVPIARRGLIRTTLGVDMVYYQTYSSERSIDPDVMVRGEAYANHLTLFAEDSYLNTRQRPSYEIDLRSRHLQNDVTAGVGVQLSPRTSFEVAALKGRTRFDGDAYFLGTSLKETLDRDTTGGSLTLRHRLTSLTSVLVEYEQLRDRFPYSPVRDTNSYSIVPGVEFKPRALINGFAHLGYRSFTPLSPELPAYTGPVASVGLTYTLLGATTFGATLDRDLAFSFETETPYYVDNSTGVFVRRAVGGRWDVIGSAARHRYGYRSLTGDAIALSAKRTDVTDNYGGSLGYVLKRHTRIAVGAAYYTRTSTVEMFRNYNGLRIGLTVTYGL